MRDVGLSLDPRSEGRTPQPVRDRLRLTVLVGPPQWEGTSMTYEVVERAEGGIVVNFDHDGFADIGGVRDWTIGWATKNAGTEEVRSNRRARPLLRRLALTRVISKRRRVSDQGVSPSCERPVVGWQPCATAGAA